MSVHIRHDTVVARDTSGTRHFTVVWADIPAARCPFCGGSVDCAVDQCPIGVNDFTLEVQGDAITCGHCRVACLPLIWRGGDAADLQSMLDIVRAEYDAAVVTENAVTEVRLRAALADREETGSEIQPGVYRDNERWIAWDYAVDGSVIDIIEEEQQ